MKYVGYLFTLAFIIKAFQYQLGAGALVLIGTFIGAAIMYDISKENV